MVDLKTPAGIILLVILLGSVMLAHVFAPGAVAVVTSMVSTLFGSLFMSFGRKGQQDTGEFPAYVPPAPAQPVQLVLPNTAPPGVAGGAG